MRIEIFQKFFRQDWHLGVIRLYISKLLDLLMRQFYLLMFFIATLLISCFRDVHHSLQKVNFDYSYNYEIKSMVGCCGCKSLYYNVYQGNLLTEQFVVETNCGLFEPTKHVFSTDAKYKVTSYKSFIAVTDNGFTVPLTELDKEAFRKLDSIYKTWTSVTPRQIVFTDIKGFMEGGKTHMPLGIKMSTRLRK